MKPNGKHKVTSVAQLIREAIFKGEFQPGDALPEMQLAKHHHVSQSTVREALVRLDYSGLVKRMPNRGTFVTNLSPQDIAERIKIRNNLEVMAASEAAARATDKDFRELESRLRKLTLAIKRNDYCAAIRGDLDFHEYIWTMSGNRLLPLILDQVSAPLMALTGLWRGRQQEELEAVTHSHQVLIDVLHGGSEEELARAFRGHVEGSYVRLLSLPG
jgi:DNA-binding GntR family transcriptional regulator